MPRFGALKGSTRELSGPNSARYSGILSQIIFKAPFVFKNLLKSDFQFRKYSRAGFKELSFAVQKESCSYLSEPVASSLCHRSSIFLP